MKLIFSPYYDQDTFISIEECYIGIKHVGPLDLLAELELRAGLSSKECNQMARLANYCKALEECIKENNKPESLFFYKSFKTDSLSVTKHLLNWRDVLVYAGLNDLNSISEELTLGGRSIISDLIEVEQYFTEKTSVADRWIRLLEATNYLDENWTIQVEMQKDLIEPTIRECIEKSGAKITFITEVQKTEHKINIHNFANLIDGYQWALSQEHEKNTVFVNQDNVSLNAVLDSLGKPFVKAEANGVFTQITQLFTSSLKLFSTPVDYYSLITYLSTRYNPLNDYITEEGYNLRTTLLNHLNKIGGFGENEKTEKDWNNIIANAKPKDGRRKHIDLEYCIGQWNLGTSKSVLEDYCSQFSSWISKTIVANTDKCVIEQLLSTKECFDVLIYILNQSNETTIPYQTLLTYINAAINSCKYTTHSPQAGSIEIIKDIKAIAGNCDKVVWLDCYDRGMINYPYSFLNNEDIKTLNKQGMRIPLYDTLLQAEAIAMQIAFSHIKKELLILTPEKIEGRKQYPIQITHSDVEINDNTSWTPLGEELEIVNANTQKEEHIVPSSIFKNLDKTESEGGLKRDYESFSSLEMLIQNPFDYVLEYLFNCRQTDNNTNLSTIKGKVAHKLINNAVIESNNDWTLIKNALSENFDKNFERAVNEVGIELLAPENALSYNQFKTILYNDSFPAFINIVENNKLTIVGSEVDITVELPLIGKFNAKIDMLLKNKNGDYIIMDFKWTNGNIKKREEEIEKNTEMQLALYTEVVEKHYKIDKSKIAATGYFMLRQGVFLTEYENFEKSDNIKVIKKKYNDSILEKVKKSYQFRIEQLTGIEGESVIEEAELLSTRELKYCQEEGLFPLKETNYKKAKTYGRNIILKGILQ